MCLGRTFWNPGEDRLVPLPTLGGDLAVEPLAGLRRLDPPDQCTKPAGVCPVRDDLGQAGAASSVWVDVEGDILAALVRPFAVSDGVSNASPVRPATGLVAVSY